MELPVYAGKPTPKPTPTPRPTHTATPTPTATPTSTPTSTPTLTPTPTPTSTPIAALQFYVSASTGNDAYAGTSAGFPWQHISKVIQTESSYAPGTTVYFLGGDVWHETLTLNQVHGSAGNPITFTAYGNGDPIIDGNGGSIGSCISADQATGTGTNVSYITIHGFECRNTSQFGINFRVENTAMRGIVIENNYIHNTGAGAYAGGAGPFDDGNYRNQLNAEDDTGGASGGDGFQLINNTVQNCGGHNCLQVHYDIGSPVVQGNAVGPGCVHNCIDTKGIVGGQIVSNVVTCPGCSAQTAAYYTENTYTANETVTYSGNLAYDVPIGFQAETGGSCASGHSPCSISAKYYNNTIYNPAQFNLIDSSCTNHTLDIEKNIVDGGTTDIHTNCKTTWNDNDDGGVFSIAGNPAGANDLTNVDPKYVNASAGNFTPQDTTVLNGGALDPVTSCVYLGAMP
ncbi:MAG TPA: hypothetical protein VHS07_04860 [Candidatus Binataceae bacterium]|nr:hypothetical protein [Candidatus Binataceae bacterium]